MNVKCAKEQISKINSTCDRMSSFMAEHELLDVNWLDEAWFVYDAIKFLSDYKNTLERAIEEAELKI